MVSRSLCGNLEGSSTCMHLSSLTTSNGLTLSSVMTQCCWYSLSNEPSERGRREFLRSFSVQPDIIPISNRKYSMVVFFFMFVPLSSCFTLRSVGQMTPLESDPRMDVLVVFIFSIHFCFWVCDVVCCKFRAMWCDLQVKPFPFSPIWTKWD